MKERRACGALGRWLWRGERGQRSLMREAEMWRGWG